TSAESGLCSCTQQLSTASTLGRYTSTTKSSQVMQSPRSPSLNRNSPLHSSLLHSEHLDSRTREKTINSRDLPSASNLSRLPFMPRPVPIETSICSALHSLSQGSRLGA